MNSCRNPRSDRHRTEGRKKEEKQADGKSRQQQEKQHLADEKQRHTGCSNGSNFTDAFRRIIDSKFDVFFDSVRSECKSYQVFLSEICDSHVNKGRNSFLQEVAALESKQSIALCELSGRREMLSFLENVSNELQRIESTACQLLCGWEHRTRSLFKGLRDTDSGIAVSGDVTAPTAGDPNYASLCDPAIAWGGPLLPSPYHNSMFIPREMSANGSFVSSAASNEMRAKSQKKGKAKSRKKCEK